MAGKLDQLRALREASLGPDVSTPLAQPLAPVTTPLPRVTTPLPRVTTPLPRVTTPLPQGGKPLARETVAAEGKRAMTNAERQAKWKAAHPGEHAKRMRRLRKKGV